MALILCLVSLSLSIRKHSFRMRVDADKTVKDFYYYNFGLSVVKEIQPLKAPE